MAGPLAGVAVWMLLPKASVGAGVGAASGEGLSAGGGIVIALAAWMGVWWMTEAVALPVTALLPLVLLPLMGVMTFEAAAVPYASEVLFLFMGGFILGLSLETTGLHLRFALLTMLGVGTSPRRLIAGVMAATALISTLVSNTATTLMMLPIGMSLIGLIEARRKDAGSEGAGWDDRSTANFGGALLLGIAYAASLGGMGTPIGSPPNLVMRGAVSATLGVEIGFWQWVVVAAPIVGLLVPLCWAMLVVMFPVRARGIEGGRAALRAQLAGLGPLRREQWFVLAVFGITVAGWVLRDQLTAWFGLTMPVGGSGGVGGKSVRVLTDAGVALFGAFVLMTVPIRARSRAGDGEREGGRGGGGGGRTVLTWEQAERLPWGVLILFGGGLSMAAAFTATGVDRFLGQQFALIAGWPVVVVLLIVVGGITLFGELAGNVAVATAVMPVLLAAAKPLGMDPLLLTFAAGFAVSCGFMLPVATPPNAIVFATGRIGMGRMLRAGAVLDLLCVVVIVGLMRVLGPTLLRWVGL